MQVYGNSLKATAPVSILLLEDDQLLRERVLVPGLKQFGFNVNAIGHAEDLDRMLSSNATDIVVLDVGLPDRSGFDVARQLRTNKPSIGIVMLTARAEISDRVRGLGEGADAYLSKPVDMDLLTATLHSLARRLQGTKSSTSQSWRLDCNGWCLVAPSGGTVALTLTESRVLVTLMKTINTVVSRDELVGSLTTNQYDYDLHRLDALIHRIRKKVLSVLGVALPLNSVHGQGYVFVSQ